VFPAILRFSQTSCGPLARGKSDGISQQVVERPSESGGFMRFHQDTSIRILGDYLALSCRRTCDYRQAGIEVLEDFIGDSEVAINDERLLEREADVVVRDYAGQVGGHDQWDELQTVAMADREVVEEGFAVTTARFP